MFTLYKKGFSHVVTTAKGKQVQVDLVRVTEEQLAEYRKKGWSDDPEKVKDIKEDEDEPEAFVKIKGKKVAVPQHPDEPHAEWIKPDGSPAKETTDGDKKPPVVEPIGYNSNDVKDEIADTE